MDLQKYQTVSRQKVWQLTKDSLTFCSFRCPLQALPLPDGLIQTGRASREEWTDTSRQMKELRSKNRMNTEA